MYWDVTAQWMERRNWEARIPGGESYHDVQARFMPLIHRLEDAYRATDANILLIGHGGTYRCMLPLLLSNIDHTSPLVQPSPRTRGPRRSSPSCAAGRGCACDGEKRPSRTNRDLEMHRRHETERLLAPSRYTYGKGK